MSDEQKIDDYISNNCLTLIELVGNYDTFSM